MIAADTAKEMTIRLHPISYGKQPVAGKSATVAIPFAPPKRAIGCTIATYLSRQNLPMLGLLIALSCSKKMTLYFAGVNRMKNFLVLATGLLVLVTVILSAGCDKERIVTSTEVVHDTKYIELPPDTVFVVDTVSGVDTMFVHTVDTVRRIDTLRINVIVHDTVTKTVNQYDTIRLVDTVTVTQFQPSATTAVAAMQAQTDPQVLQFAKDSLGLTGGWVFYLTPAQMQVIQVSAKVWDIYAYVDYWAPDWSGYYPLEVYWRMTYKSSDPTAPNNWTMTDPPAAVSGRPNGVSASAKAPLTLQATPPLRELELLK